MKRTIYLPITITILLWFSANYWANGQTYLYEDFEDGVKPTGWIYIYESGIVDWQYLDGGYSNTGAPGTGHPQYAKQGVYNAMFHKESFSGQKTKLVTSVIDLEFGIKPELSFWHAQDERYTFENWNNDELRVYYKEHEDSTWKMIAEYTEKVNIWTERVIQLPDSTLSGTYYIAFEGKTNNGYGACIDSVALVEKGVIPKYLESIDVRQASTEFVATESKNNQILRIDFTVKGNDGILKLDSLAVKSLNTDDSDLTNNGVKLFTSDDNIFSNSIQIGSGMNFIDGILSFTNINRILPTGFSSVWITYDIAVDVNHEKHDHIVDAKINKEDIKINTSYYPLIDKSPDGDRTVFESILYDDFETDKGWIFTGEFERDVPLGLGGINKGSPDPDYAVSGDYIIGTDLTGLGDNIGDYELNLSDKEYSASSSYINCKYYKDTYLYFDRWFNMDSYDLATIDINTVGADNWQTYWQSSGTSINNKWSTIKYSLDTVVSRKDSVKIRYTLGPTNDFWNFSGWNIDNVIIVGNYIARDVSITEWIDPLDGCGHTDEEYITVKIKNLAGEPMDEPLPVSYSFDEGITIYYDTIYSTIPVDDSLTYQIDKPIDLTTPGWYNNVYATTHLAGDEDNTNNKIELNIFITPTYNLPYYENFETNYGYYLSGGTNSSWEYGTPAGTVIDAVASGTKAWVTNLIGEYEPDDSSYLESPCFNFAGTDSIVFEFKCKGLSEDKTDGLSLLYSLNEGTSWNIVPNDNDFYWNWYNETSISELELPGIDTTDGEWLTFKQLLPEVLSNQSSAKFKFVFESNGNTNYEGFGIDDIKIYDAPYDVGVTSLNYPYDRCEWNDTTHVKVYIENYGITTIETGSKIPVGLDFKGSYYTTDTLTLTSNLAPNESVLFTFSETVDMSYAGDYDFTIYTKLESNPYFYNNIVCNDSLVAMVSVTGMPRYNPFPDQIGDNPIDTFLVASTGYISYDWTRPVLPDTTTLTTDTLLAKNEGWYKVTVTNGVGCTAIDSVEVVNSDIDLAMDSLYTELEDSCHRNALTELSVHYINKSINLLAVDDTILLGYQINNNPVVQDSMFLTEEIAVDDTAWFVYNEKADLREPGPYTIKVFTNFLRDLNHADDTVTKTVNTNGYVDVELNYDTVYSSQADTLEIIATPGYANYSWIPTETNDTISPINNVSQWYKVTVTDTYACGEDSDSTYVETYDFGVSDVLGFANNCDYNFAVDTALKIEIANYSGNTYISGDSIWVYYNFDNNGWQSFKINLTSTFDAYDTLSFEIGTIDPTAVGEHTLKIYTSSPRDANHSNDTLEYSFETWPYPNVELAYDTIYTTKADTVVLVANSGWASYLWNTGSTNESISITNLSSLKYIVEVSDEHSCGIAKDSTQIISYNIGISDIIAPVNSCEHTSTEKVRIEVQNFSKDTMDVGEIINVAYVVNNGTPVNESFPLAVTLLPNQTAEYQFDQKVNLSTIGMYTFKVYTDYELDVRRSNDTLVDAISTFGYPTIEIGPDILTSQPDTVSIIAEPGYVKYEWSNGVENDTLNITYPASQLYVLTVTNTNGCIATDDISIYTYDVAADSLAAPFDQCELSSTETVKIGVINTSEDTLQIGEALDVGFILNSGSYISESFTLTEILYPDSLEFFTFVSNTADLSVNQLHQFKLFAKLTNIDVLLNDTATASVDFQKTEFDLGADVNTGNAQYTIDAGTGFASYLWFDGSTDQTYTVDINDQTPNRHYAVTITNDKGCEASDSIEVTFDITQDIGVTALLSPESECWQSEKTYQVQITIQNLGAINISSGTPVNIGYRIDNGTPVIEDTILNSALNANDTFDFTFPDNITFDAADIYEVKPFVKLDGDEDVDNDTLLVGGDINISQPDIDLGSDTVKFTESTYEIIITETYTSYEWSTGETTSSIVISETGTYSVTVTDDLGCQGSDSIYCEKLTGIDYLIKGDGYTITYYPNPVTDELRLEIVNSKSKDLYVDLINIQGQVIYNKKYGKTQNTIERIDVNPYAKGVYYIRFRIDDKFYIRKIIIQ